VKAAAVNASVCGMVPHMASSPAFSRRCRAAWALSEPSAVLLWRLGIGWCLLAAVVDAWTGRRLVLSGFVLIGPYCVLFTGRWLRTAVAGAWAIVLVVVLAVPDGIWGSRLETSLIGLAVFAAVSSTLALVITRRAALLLAVSAVLAACGGGHAISAGRRHTVSVPPPVPCGQQYEAWKHGLGFVVDRKLQAVVKAVQAAENSGNAAAMASAMRQLMPAAMAAANAYVIPRCADPHGFYSDYITGSYEAGYAARSAKGLSGLWKAAEPLKGLTNLESRLTAEVNRAVAKT